MVCRCPEVDLALSYLHQGDETSPKFTSESCGDSSDDSDSAVEEEV